MKEESNEITKKYPLNGLSGVVIKDVSESVGSIDVTVSRCIGDTVTIKSELDKKNIVKNPSDLLPVVCILYDSEIPRIQQHLSITIQQPGRYNVTVPEHVYAAADMNYGNIIYHNIGRHSVIVKVLATRVNRMPLNTMYHAVCRFTASNRKIIAANYSDDYCRRGCRCITYALLRTRRGSVTLPHLCNHEVCIPCFRRRKGKSE
jgi:hypothetical protein